MNTKKTLLLVGGLAAVMGNRASQMFGIDSFTGGADNVYQQRY